MKLWDKWLVSAWGRGIIIRLTGFYNHSRAIYLKNSLKCCGDPVHLQFPIYLTHSEMIEIGNNVSLAGFIHVWGGGGVKIGSRVMIGSHTAISSVTHDYSAETMYGTVVTKPIVINDDVWIGTHAVILPGVTIGEGAVIAAGCVVTKDVPARAIVAGVPGRLLRFRPNVEELEELHSTCH